MSITTRFLQDGLASMGPDALLFNTSEVLPSVNLRYITGFTGSDAAALITEDELHLFTDGRYKTQAKEQAPGFRVHVVRKKFDAIARAIERKGILRLGIESQRMSFAFVTELKRKLRDVDVIPIKREFLENLRIRKTPEEHRRIALAARTASSACEALLGKPLAGRRERDVAVELESLFRVNGADAVAFDTIVASGPRSALPHGTASEKTIETGELVIIDFGCTRDDYHSDETVTCIVGGEPTPDQQRIYEAVREAHDRAVDYVRPGVRANEVDKIARETITNAGYGKYFLHGLGHGLGMEVHEPPILSFAGKSVLEEGMVFTIEPGIYLEGVGGVRLESLVYLTASGPEILSRMPKDLLRAG